MSSGKDLLFLTKHLGTMLKSGISIGEVLEILAEQAQSPALKKIVLDVGVGINSGKMLSEAMSRHPKTFSKFFVSMIKVGETSGSLEESLGYLSTQLEKDYAFKQKVTAASLYPIIVLCMAFGVVTQTVVFTLPKLSALFKSFDSELPFATRVVLAISDWSRDYGVVSVIGFIVFIVALKFITLFEPFKFWWESFLFKLPVIGDFIKSSELTIISRNMGIMLKNGIPISEALSIQQASSKNSVYQKYLMTLLREVNNGQSMDQVFRDGNFENIPIIAKRMIAVGEKSGKLDESFLYIGDFFEAEVDSTSKNLTAVLEPALLIVIGLLVGFLALAIISPVYEFTAKIRR